jgi:hypothetical protein
MPSARGLRVSTYWSVSNNYNHILLISRDVARATRPLLAPIGSCFRLCEGDPGRRRRLAMRHVRDVIRMKAAGVPSGEIARRSGPRPRRCG